MQINETENNEKKLLTIKKSSLFLSAVLLIAVVIVVTVFVLSYLAPYVYAASSVSATTITDEDLEKYERLEQVLQFYQANYIEEFDEEEAVNAAIQGLIDGIGDKYGTYFTAEEAEVFYAESEGEYGGIGVVVNIDTETNTLTVTQVYSDTPAEKAGFQTGDIIYKVDGVEVIGMESTEVVNMVKGDEGTDVVVTVLRDGVEIDMPMTRAIVVAERATWEMVEGNIAYIKLYEFNGNCADLFFEAIEELVEEGGAEGIILDLRSNPGGDKSIVVEIADALLPAGPIITLIDNEGNEDVDYSDSDYIGLPLVVLVNEYSASASELLSGAIQDYEGIGVVIGETTYGKGVAQSFTGWSDGSLLRYTSSKYLTPSGYCPQDVGIIPDIEVILNEEVANDSTLLTTEADNQMQEAISVVKDIISGDYIVD